MKDFRYMSIVAAAALGLAVAGCGSSGSDTTTAPPVEDTSLADAQTAAMTAATAAATAATAAEAAANAQEANKASDVESYVLAQDAAMRARAAANAAAAANTAAQAATTPAAAEAQQAIAEGHQATAETERGNAVMHAGMVAAAKTTADNAAMAAAEKAAANKVALSKKTAIMAEATATTGARPFDLTADPAIPNAPTADENYALTVKHTGSAVEVTVVDGHDDYDAKNDPKFIGNGQMLVRDDGTDREIIVVHTDIEAPESVRFGASKSGYSLTVDVDKDTSALDSYVVQPNDASKLGGSRIVSSDPGSKTLAAWTSTGDGAANVFAGTLDGAAGMFRCETGPCVVTTDDDDDNTVMFTGTLWFTPAAGATVSVADKDYLTYGFWLDTTTKDGEISSYDAVQTFAMSELPASTNLGNVEGTASYEGDAAGVYVHETKKEDGNLDTATSGRFTADVALTAYFDVPESSTKKDGTIEGTISNFDLDGGPDNEWNVKLSATGINVDTGFTGNASGMTGDNGSLSGQFHGTENADDDTVAPPVLVGEFNANFVNGAVAGAYGARKQ